MLLSAVSVLVVVQSSSEIPEGLMNNPVYQNILMMHGPLNVELLVAYRGQNSDSPLWPQDQSLLRCPAAIFSEFWLRRHVAAPRARNTARLCRRFWLRCCCDTRLQSPAGTRQSLPWALNSSCLSTSLRVFVLCAFLPLSFSVSQNGHENNRIVCLSLDSSIPKSN